MTEPIADRPIRRPLPSTLTPVQMARALRDRPGLCALIGTWHRGGAVIAFDPVRVADDPFALPLEPPTTDDRCFGGGWIGYWGYQLGRRIERLPQPPPRPYPLAESWLAYYDHVLVYDDTDGWTFEAIPTGARRAYIDAAYDRIRSLAETADTSARAYQCGEFTMTPDPATHRRVIESTLEHITAGDIFQANLCVRLEAEMAGNPLDVFCAGVEALRPRYAGYVAMPDGAVASLSPELFLRRRGRDVRTAPIKGTASLTSDVAAFSASYKNRAENIMIVDLMRNDLGRVAEPGSVSVPDQPRAQRHTGVWHLVSEVDCRLAEDTADLPDDAALLRAAFPPGSVTGAPKVRAMELINELETTGREVYTGAVGYRSAYAGLELNVAIRTFEFRAGRVWLGVGGGIVADSVPDEELRECLVKAEPLLTAIGSRLETETAAQVGESAPGRSAPPGRAIERTRPNPAAGVFETLRVVDGSALYVREHLQRLAASASELYDATFADDLPDRIAAAAAGCRRYRMRIDLHPDGTDTITTTPMPGGDPAPWRLTPTQFAGGLGAYKWCDRDALTGLAPAGDGWPLDHDPLLLDGDEVLETGRGNLFVVDDHGVHTPELDGRILPGVTRRRVLDLLRSAGVPAYERAIDVDELGAAAEVFVTNALRGAVPAVECFGVGEWAPGPTTAWIADRLERAVAPPLPSPVTQRRVLLIDNYDSFVYNLDQYCRELSATTTVVRNDAVTVADIEGWVRDGDVDRIVISPGPGTPADAGISVATVARLGARVPILGVCLGQQSIAEAYGAKTVRAREVVHGKLSLVHHDGRGVFAGIDGPLASGRYHSLVVDEATLPDRLAPTAHTASGVLMGLRHRDHPVEGVQLHPESILTRHGHRILANFLA